MEDMEENISNISKELLAQSINTEDGNKKTNDDKTRLSIQITPDTYQAIRDYKIYESRVKSSGLPSTSEVIEILIKKGLKAILTKVKGEKEKKEKEAKATDKK